MEIAAKKRWEWLRAAWGVFLCLLLTGSHALSTSASWLDSPEGGVTAAGNTPSAPGIVIGWGRQVTPLIGIKSVTAIAAGGGHNLELKRDGTVVSWGWDLGDLLTVPAGLHDVIAIAAAVDRSLALKRDGTVVAWGDNENGESTGIKGLSEVRAVSVGVDHSLAAVITV